ncbi:hypothetical protein A7985_23270 [Pseudoalteromonas luteoviolacea]|uniref:Penicillin acylase family protein n=1 Tax=Pseudoalteromonas luteoviolacea TaxID=43657 RepID=A0A1C0TJG7_9GAMM|nr:penicillin acylase family protein [Pseudoalteromonas luteoviolacea]OCQ18693.1 hypothetical protein A7985_23270 [Pseudoalteromonas luteoviolacea]
MFTYVRKRHPLILRLMLWVVLPFAAAIFGTYMYVTQSLPTAESHLVVPGLTQDTLIEYDQYGVATITAEHDNDAFFALGYVHAQNRMWQMEMQRRLGTGRLSEVFGKELLQTDMFMRTLGLHHVTQKNQQHLSATELASLESYAQGVNAWLAQQHTLPPEFLILGLKPETWTVNDSMLQIKLMALSLDGNFRKDLALRLLIKTLGEDQAMQIMPDYSKATPVVVQEQYADDDKSASAQLLNFTNHLYNQFKLGGKGVGSNAWVVDGSHTESGQPLLANDTHLKTQIPSQWFLAKIKGHNIDVSGATIPGLPLVLIGRNPHIAWGVTALTADVQDIYQERFHEKNDTLYETADGWKELMVREELIQVRADFPSYLNPDYEPVKWHARATHNGPLISDVIGKVTTPMSLSWTALDPKDHSYSAFMRVNYAKDWGSFRDALKRHGAPALNFLYADLAGNIGYQVAGKLPSRALGDGTLPLPSWQENTSWQGYLPQSDLPTIYNPKSGYIVSANNKIASGRFDSLINGHWAPGYRAQRIEQLLTDSINGSRKFSVQDFVSMQGDKTSLQADQLVHVLRAVTPKNAKQAQALNYLKTWDATFDEDSIAASIYHVWRKFYNQNLLQDPLTAQPINMVHAGDLNAIQGRLYPRFMDNVVNHGQTHWCDNALTENAETCTDIARTALQQAIEEISLELGNDMDSWQWSNLYKAYFPHTGFGTIRLLDYLFNREVSSGGSDYTVDVAVSKYQPEQGYRQTTGAAYRQVINLDAWQDSGFLVNTGQSGNVLSDHYDDLIPLLTNTELLPMGNTQTIQSIRLQPMTKGAQK